MRPAALVTGSAKGIGRALLLMLAERGHDVIVHYRSSADEAEAVAELARGLGAHAATIRADVTDEAAAHGLVDAAAERLGRLDVVINNVGNYDKGPLDEVSSASWHEMFDSNLHATYYVCQRAAPILRASPQGRIVNVGYAGVDALVAKPGIIGYQIAKTGVLLYSRALAKREARHGTTVNVVAPGVIENSVTQPIDEIPMGRPGTLDEMASTVAFLVSDEARYVTGAFLPVAGGWNL
ncbi:MAG: bifunctional dihydropteridine reductase/dihydrofolate reductase TmpR [Trueperaceae bacterium]|nr:bifunctional dihydropteridine reductase/dihydrofolate reductase TmpR [Trueperaceae bacterium]